MNTLQIFWDHAKQASIEAYSGITRFKSLFQTWLNNTLTYGVMNPDELRSWALQFDLSRREFSEALNEWFKNESERLHYTVNNHRQTEICPRCGQLEWSNLLAAYTVYNGRPGAAGHVCTKCFRSYYRECGHCGRWRELTINGEPFVISIRQYANICFECIETHPESYVRCDSCARWQAVSNNMVFRYDRIEDRLGIHWVDNPGGAVWVCTNCQSPEHSRCRPKHPEFAFPALNLGPDRTVAQDEIFEISHNGGEIAQTGLSEIYNLIDHRTKGHMGHGIQLVELTQPDYNFDSRWMTREGNFPKRIARLLLQLHSLKLTEDLMSEIGNIAQRYATKPGTYRLSITRDVNRPRSEFVNGDSCWWTNYWWSRCNLKSLGGFGLRTWDGDKPIGRAWMLPMTVTPEGRRRLEGTMLAPAPEKLPADAYIIFNGYGPNNSRLDSLEFGRLVAAMTGKSYRKINFGVNSHLMYVNGTEVHSDQIGKGVLVAEQSVCDLVSVYSLRTVPAAYRCTCPGKPL